MTFQDLVKKLKSIGIDEKFYSFNSLEPDKLIIKCYHGIWEVFYHDERGSIHDEIRFTSENKACDYIFNYFENSSMSIPRKKKMQKRKEKHESKKPINTPDVIILDK